MPYADKAVEKQRKHDRYQERRKDPEFLAKEQKYRDEHAERNREYQRIYRLTHAEQLEVLKAKRKHLWASSSKDYQREYARQYAVKFRQQVLKMYGGKCACCGEAHQEFLQIDHIDGTGADHRKSGCGVGHRFYRWLVKNGCPRDNYRLLCSNCNWARGRYGYCPHEQENSLPKGTHQELIGGAANPV
jgi:predicted restriction endonuclease